MEKTGNVVVGGCAADGPEKSSADFIANGDYRGRDASTGKGIRDCQSIIINFPCKISNGIGRPARGDCLVKKEVSLDA